MQQTETIQNYLLNNETFAQIVKTSIREWLTSSSIEDVRNTMKFTDSESK